MFRKKLFKRILTRAFFYMRQGYSLASLPFALLGYASSIYYLAIKNIPLLEYFFPHFSDFLFLAAVTLPVSCVLLGWIYMKRSFLFRTAQEIIVESNPYNVSKIAPVVIPFWEMMSKLAKLHGIDTSRIDKILQESQKK